MFNGTVAERQSTNSNMDQYLKILYFVYFLAFQIPQLSQFGLIQTTAYCLCGNPSPISLIQCPSLFQIPIDCYISSRMYTLAFRVLTISSHHFQLPLAAPKRLFTIPKITATSQVYLYSFNRPETSIRKTYLKF